MQTDHFKRIDKLVKRSPIIIAGIYFLFSVIWIAYSDSWVLGYYDDPQVITTIQTYKGWFFVSLSSLVIYALVLSSNQTISKYFKNKLRLENTFEATFEQAAVGISHHDEKYNWLRVNNRLCEMLQYSKSEFMKLSLKDFVHPDDLDHGEDLDQKLFKGELPSYQVEKRYRRKDGTIIYVLLSKNLARDADNKPMFFVSVLEDITYLKEVEKNLERAYQLAEIGSWKYDLKRHKIYWSKEVQKFFEVESDFEPDIGNITQFYNKKRNRKKITDAMNRCIEKGESFDEEIQIITAKGQERWIKIIGEAQMIEGECISLFGSAQNIDYRKKAEIRNRDLYLSERNQRLHTEKVNQRLNILDQVGSMFVKSNADQNSIFGKISTLLVQHLADICSIDLYVEDKLSRVAQAIYPQETKEILDATHRTGADHYYNQELVKEALRTGEALIIKNINDQQFEDKFEDKSQLEVYKTLQIHSLMIFPIVIKEKVSGIISLEWTAGSGKKISEEDDLFLTELANKMALFIENRRMRENLKSFNKKLEQQVTERTRQLEIINQELESFSYSVSHDLRSPLRAISGYASLLREDHSKQLKGEGKEFLEIIESEVKRMGRLIDDLLAFSRLSRTGMQMVDFNMENLVRQCVEEIERSVSMDDVQIDIQNLENVIGDSNLLKQVWVNLISNAVKYRKENVSVDIKIRGIFDDANQRVIYSIQDNGVGFDMKYSDKLFGVFQRLHSDDQFEGTGIGLALVKRIVNRHNGEVWAESKPGIGSVFYFSIPLYFNNN